jgi:tRNA(Ile)-lysidine synthase
MKEGRSIPVRIAMPASGAVMNAAGYALRERAVLPGGNVTMIKAIQNTIHEHDLLRSGQTVLVAVSGGADSVSLLYVLHFLQRRYKLTLVVLHLNHALRGSEADRDQEFVCQLAWRLKIPVRTLRVEVSRLAEQEGLSLEMAAREARLAFFHEMAREYHADAVAVGHTADDQVETVLLRLFRGCGLQGLAGIPHQGTVRGLRIIRPLRDVTHQETVHFLRHHALPWCEDSSNAQPVYQRNRLRNEVLPLLRERFNPRVDDAVLRTSALLAAENEWMDAQAQQAYRGCLDPLQPATLRVTGLTALPRVLARRVVLCWLYARDINPGCLDAQTVDRIVDMGSRSEGSERVELGAQRVVVRFYDHISVQPEYSHEPYRYRLDVPGQMYMPELGLQVTTECTQGVVRERHQRPGAYPVTATLSADAVDRAGLFIRSWHPGDRMKPMGMKGSRKLQDIFVDLRVPRDQRAWLPMLECRQEIVWLPGYRVARGWDVPDAHARSIQVRIDRFTEVLSF